MNTSDYMGPYRHLRRAGFQYEDDMGGAWWAKRLGGQIDLILGATPDNDDPAAVLVAVAGDIGCELMEGGVVLQERNLCEDLKIDRDTKMTEDLLAEWVAYLGNEVYNLDPDDGTFDEVYGRAAGIGWLALSR